MTSLSKPTSELVDAAVPLLGSPQHAKYFFDRLQNPHWIEPLRERDVFAHPPGAEHVDDGGLRYPPWPESQYLARMAAHAPSEVAAIFASFQTDNASIIGDMLDAASRIPPSEAKRLVPAICQAAEAGNLWIHFKDACELCVRLTNGGQVPAAVLLAESLFAPKFEEGEEEPSRRDDYWYKEGLKEVVPALAAKGPPEFISTLCDWLKASIEAIKFHDRKSGSDYSYMWRPRIAEHEQNKDYYFAGAMVGFAREGFEQAINGSKLSLVDALKILGGYQYSVFKRMRLHLIDVFAKQSPELVRETILERDFFDDLYYRHEYAALVGHQFCMLSPEDQALWLGWVEDGPDMRSYEEFIKGNTGRAVTEQERQGHIEKWKRDKLHMAREHLDGSWREFYDRMRAQHGEPDPGDLVLTARWGSESAMTLEDLGHMTFEQVVEKVSSWKPQEFRPMGPDIEGLASVFGQYVATNPEAFSRQARILVKRPAIYVRMFVNKMAEALKAGRDVDILTLLDLCRWVVEQPTTERTTLVQPHEVLVDKDWQWTRDEISRLMEIICQAKVDESPRYPLAGLREPIWGIINVLCRDRAESYVVHDTAKDDLRVRDYLDLGINSPRGKAVGAVLEYARWVANHIKQLENGQEIVPGGFEAMPEVREITEWQIAPQNRSVEVLSVIGAHLGLICWIDKAWLEKNAFLIFNLEDIESKPSMAHGWAAWNAFLVWVGPHIEFYRLFKKQFAYAVKQAARVHLPERSHQQPMYHLGEHLMILYGRGQLGLDDDGGLLKRFLADSVSDIRRHAIGFIGRSLEREKDVPKEVIERFMTLWDVYWDGVGKKDAAEKPDAWLFGPWFTCGQFPPQWLLDRLDQFVEVVPIPEPDHELGERLAAIAQTDIVKAVRILDRMIRGDREGWHIHGWLDPAKQVLERAMNTGGDARAVAAQAIDFLGRRGYPEFGNLLNVKGEVQTP